MNYPGFEYEQVMAHQIRILQASDKDAILQYERKKLYAIEPNDFERGMLEWHAPWRAEALDHYLPLGWSLAVFNDEGDLLGYFIAQPQVFTRTLAQTLWVERLQFDSPELMTTLMEVAYKLCREKHFQQLLIAKTPELEAAMSVSNSGPFAELLSKIETPTETVFALKTARI